MHQTSLTFYLSCRDRSIRNRSDNGVSYFSQTLITRSFALLPKRKRSQLFLVQCSVLFFLLTIKSISAHADNILRLGVLKFGTVNWELSVIKQLKLDEQFGFSLEVVPLAGKNATHVAIQGGAVDMIVSDWIWVSRLRSSGKDYTFAPYSTAAGSVMVHPESGIQTVADLKGKGVGVAGGPVDKSWLLLSAFTRKTLGEPIEKMTRPSFAAPPLINELLVEQEFPAVLNYWHYSARLKALGMRELIQVSDLLDTLGIRKQIPLIGWVFSEDWAGRNSDVIEGFLAASQAAQERMRIDDELWHSLRPMMKAETEEMAITLRYAFRDGIIQCFDALSADSISDAFSIIAEIGGKKLVGNTTSLAEGTVWPASIASSCQ